MHTLRIVSIGLVLSLAACETSAGLAVPAPDAAGPQVGLGTSPPPSGIPAAPPLAVDPIDFGVIRAGTAAFGTTSVGNVGDRAVFVDGVGVDGGAYTVVATTCAGALPPHASCTVQVEFQPADVGPAAGVLRVDAGGRAEAALRGAGGGTIKVTRAGGASGFVVADDGSLACPDTCEALVGGPVTLSVVPALGAKFMGWSGACKGTATCVVSPAMAPVEVTADFESGGLH